MSGKLHAYDAVSKIGRGFGLDEIKGDFDLDCSDKENRVCWRDTTSGAYLFAQAAGSKHLAELHKLIEYIDAAIDSYWAAKEKANESVTV